MDDGTQNLQTPDIKLNLALAFFLPHFLQLAKGDPVKAGSHELASHCSHSPYSHYYSYSHSISHANITI